MTRFTEETIAIALLLFYVFRFLVKRIKVAEKTRPIQTFSDWRLWKKWRRSWNRLMKYSTDPFSVCFDCVMQLLDEDLIGRIYFFEIVLYV